MAARKMPLQKPGRSEQAVSTPRDFLDAVELRFGRITFDLAADESNAKARFYYDKELDSLQQDWTLLVGNLWLNPEFAYITPWARKAKQSLVVVRDRLDNRDRHNWRLLMLTPASVGSVWYADSVHEHARVIALRPRLVFDGSTQGYPKDLILAVYGTCETPGFELWRWRDCARECERSSIAEAGESIDLPDLEHPRPNMPKRRRREEP